MKKDLAEFGDAMTQEVTELTNAAKGGLYFQSEGVLFFSLHLQSFLVGIGTATNVIKEQAQYLEKLVTPDTEQKRIVEESLASATNADTSSTSLSDLQSNEESLTAKVCG